MSLSPTNPVLMRKLCAQFNRRHPVGTAVLVMLGPGRSIQRTIKEPGAYVRGRLPVVQVSANECVSLENVAGSAP
jgi:hypothetical protein